MTEPRRVRQLVAAVGAVTLAAFVHGCGDDATSGPRVDGSAAEESDASPHDAGGGSDAPSFRADDYLELALWLDAADDDTITEVQHGRVAVWNDKSGRGNHAYQGSDRLMPTRVANARAERATLRFDGAYLTTSDPIQLRANSAGYTVFAVAMNTVADGVEDSAERGGIILGSFGRSEPNVGIELHHDRRLRHWWDRRDGPDQPADGNRGDAILAEPRPDEGAYAILLFTLDAERGLAGGGVDGAFAEEPDTGPPYEVRTPLRIGADYREQPLSVAFRGELAEIMVFERLLSADDIATVHAYLSHKWEIALRAR